MVLARAVIGDAPERRVEILSELLEGELTVRLGPEGEGVTVPAGVPHSVSLAGSEPARLLDVHTPSCGFGDFVRALREGLEGEVVAERVAFDQRAPR